MKSITKAQYAMLFFSADRLKEDSWYTGPYGFDALKERGLVDFGQHDRHCVRETYACRPGEHADDRETGDSRI